MRKTYWASSAQRRSSPVFSMSFLDLLANTLGTLIFIMILLFLQVSHPDKVVPAADSQIPVADRLHELKKDWEKAQHDLTEADSDRTRLEAVLKNDPEAIERERDRLLQKAREAQAQAERLKPEIEQARQAKEDAERQRNMALDAKRAGKKLPFPTGGGAVAETRSITEFYHVICDRDGLVITHQPSIGAPEMDGLRVKKEEIEKEGSGLRRALDGVKKAATTSMMVLWVKPSGLETYGIASGLAEAAEIKQGDEPADENLEFQSTGK